MVVTFNHIVKECESKYLEQFSCQSFIGIFQNSTRSIEMTRFYFYKL